MRSNNGAGDAVEQHIGASYFPFTYWRFADHRSLFDRRLAMRQPKAKTRQLAAMIIVSIGIA